MKLIESLRFTRKVVKLLSDMELYRVQKSLVEAPNQGKVIRKMEGARKMRIPLSKGKSGGARVIYFYQDKQGAIYFLDIFAKKEKENLTAEDEREILREVRNIKKGIY